MNAKTAAMDNSLARTLSARRETCGRRLIVAALSALGFAPLTGWGMAAAWLSVYAALQACERRWLSDPGRELALALLALESLVFVFLAIAAVLSAGAWGAAAGAVLLTAALFEAANSRQRSWPAFVATAAPLCLALIVVAVIPVQGTGGWAAAFAIAVASGVAVLSSVRSWKGAAEGHAARRRARAEVDRRRLEAVAAAGAASQFATAAGHELRTPLAAILTASDALEQRVGDDPALRRQAATICDAGRAMSALLDQLQDQAALDAGRLQVDSIRFDLRELLGDVAAQWAGPARRKGLYLRTEGVEGLPEPVVGDPMRLRQVVNTLIANALKSAETGGVTLNVAAVPLAEDERPHDCQAAWLVRIGVRDTRPGLTSDEIARAFTPVGAAGNSTAGAGVAMGLGVSRQLARLMGGDLFATSEPDGGAFTLEVVLAEAAATRTDAEDLRVLVADGTESGRRSMALTLEPYGVQVATAATAQAALDLLGAQAFDVILLDLALPELGGKEACRRLRAEPGPNRSTPVVACATADDNREWEACRRAGMNAMVAKPIAPSAIHAAIASALRTAASQAAA